MTINIVNWNDEIKHSKTDQNVGIKIATLSENGAHGTYLTILKPGISITPHYHTDGDEEYHIIRGSGVIRLLPALSDFNLKWICKYVNAETSFTIPANMIHQLINTGVEPLTLIFSCPIAHLNEDRILVNLDEVIYE